MRTRKIAVAFGGVLRETRLQKGISQDNLAFICDFDRTYPSMLERGLRSPTLAMIFRLSEALEISPDVLVANTYAELRRLDDSRATGADRRMEPAANPSADKVKQTADPTGAGRQLLDTVKSRPMKSLTVAPEGLGPGKQVGTNLADRIEGRGDIDGERE